MPDRPKILFIDDETHWSESYHRQLWSKFDVVTARTSEEALSAISKQRDVDVVILDIMMPTPANGDEEHEPVPERSGLRLLEELRSRASLDTQFVIYSSYLSDLRDDFDELGTKFISKSQSNPDGMVSRVEEIIYEGKIESKARKERTAVAQSIKREIMEEIKLNAPIRERTLHIPGESNFELIKPLIGFKRDIERHLSRYDYDRNVFLMMKFRSSNRDLSDFILENLKEHKLNGVRADADEWNITGNVYNPIAALYCCKFGIALFDEPEEHQAFSPNVAYELGMMHYQGKNCLILKHSTLPQVPFDLIKDLYVEYDKDLRVRSIVQSWIKQVRHSNG